MPAPHLIDVYDAGWTVHHRPACFVATPDDGRQVVCLIQDLADEQLPVHPALPGLYRAAARDGGAWLVLTPAVGWAAA
jgi:hypothetical protein